MTITGYNRILTFTGSVFFLAAAGSSLSPLLPRSSPSPLSSSPPASASTHISFPLSPPPAPACCSLSSMQDIEARRLTTESCRLSSPCTTPLSIPALKLARPFWCSSFATLELAMASRSWWPPSDIFRYLQITIVTSSPYWSN